ncbi:ATP-binding protein [Streptomyces sp. NPDC087270]
MVASLSSLGYSLPAAITDLIDNSISADAQNIDVDFTWAGRDS